tara:strand:+ start:22716 stop:24077 length:1362 start_codon:yes stop_codon:yes gene_type:complete
MAEVLTLLYDNSEDTRILDENGNFIERAALMRSSRKITKYYITRFVSRAGRAFVDARLEESYRRYRENFSAGNRQIRETAIRERFVHEHAVALADYLAPRLMSYILNVPARTLIEIGGNLDDAITAATGYESRRLTIDLMIFFFLFVIPGFFLLTGSNFFIHADELTPFMITYLATTVIGMLGFALLESILRHTSLKTSSIGGKIIVRGLAGTVKMDKHQDKFLRSFAFPDAPNLSGADAEKVWQDLIDQVAPRSANVSLTIELLNTNPAQFFAVALNIRELADLILQNSPLHEELIRILIQFIVPDHFWSTINTLLPVHHNETDSEYEISIDIRRLTGDSDSSEENEDDEKSGYNSDGKEDDKADHNDDDDNDDGKDDEKAEFEPPTPGQGQATGSRIDPAGLRRRLTPAEIHDRRRFAQKSIRDMEDAQGKTDNDDEQDDDGPDSKGKKNK